MPIIAEHKVDLYVCDAFLAAAGRLPVFGAELAVRQTRTSVFLSLRIPRIDQACLPPVMKQMDVPA